MCRNRNPLAGVICSLLTCGVLAQAASPSHADESQEPQGSITGRVLDADSRPAAGVDVVVHNYRVREETTTDDEGRFAIEVPKFRVSGAIVVARTDGNEQMDFFRTPYNETHEAAPVELTLKPSQRIVIQVNDSAGQPIVAARAGVIAANHTWDSQLTGTDGRTEITLPQNAKLHTVYSWKAATGIDYQILGDAAAIQSSAAGNPGDGPQFQLVLSDPITIDIKVVDAVEGLPLPGIPVMPARIAKAGESGEFGLFYLQDQLQVATDAKGVASFDWLPAWNTAESLQIAPFSDEHVVKPREFKPANRSGRFTISLEELVPIRGEVRLPNGDPAAGVGVYAAGSGEAGSYFSGWEQTDAAGRYEFLANPNQAYLVYVIDDQWAAVPHAGFTLLHGEPIEDMDFKLRPATRVFGRVTSGPDNEPVEGYNVNIEQYGVKVNIVDGKPVQQPPNENLRRLPSHQRSAKTNSDGVFEYFVGPGTFHLFQNRQLVEFTIANENEREFSFTVPHTETTKLQGRVVAGVPPRPMPQAVVLGVYRGESSGPDLFAITDGEGRFELERKRMPLLVYAQTQDETLLGAVDVGIRDSAVTIEMVPPAAFSATLIDDTTGKPLPNQELHYGVTVFRDGTPPVRRFTGRMTTGADGRFRIKGLIVGQPYDFRLPDPGFGQQPLGAVYLPPTSGEVVLGTLRLKHNARPPTTQERVAAAFDQPGDSPADRFEASLRQARRDHTHLLLLLGQPSSLEVEQFFAAREENRSVRKVLDDFGLLALSTSGDDVFEVHTLAAQRQFPIGDANRHPRLIILSSAGDRLADKKLTDLVVDDRLDLPALTFFLLQHRPLPVDARTVLDEALTQAKAVDKRVFLQESARGCEPCHQLAQFLDKHRDLLGKDYLHVKVDQRWKHAGEVMHALRAGDGGIPWYAILDADGEILATADSPAGNVGFPAGDSKAIDYFLDTLRTSSQRLTEDDLDVLRADLENR